MTTLAALGIAIPDDNVVREFTPWLPWTSLLDGTKPHQVSGRPLQSYSGAYILAHFDKLPPRGPANPVAPELIYVGEAGNLGRRWREFRGAITAGGSHSGGQSYRRRFGKRPRPGLHVAAFPVWLRKRENEGDPKDPHSLTCRLRHYVEQAVLWHLHLRALGPKLLNKK